MLLGKPLNSHIAPLHSDIEMNTSDMFGQADESLGGRGGWREWPAMARVVCYIILLLACFC